MRTPAKSRAETAECADTDAAQKFALAMAQIAQTLLSAHERNDAGETSFGLQLAIAAVEDMRTFFRAYFETLEWKARFAGEDAAAPIYDSELFRGRLENCTTALAECSAMPTGVRDPLSRALTAFFQNQLKAVDVSALLAGAKEQLRSRRDP